MTEKTVQTQSEQGISYKKEVEVLDWILVLLLSIYIMHGLGFGIGLAGVGKVNFLGFVLAILFWPYFKGVRDGEDRI